MKNFIRDLQKAPGFPQENLSGVPEETAWNPPGDESGMLATAQSPQNPFYSLQQLRSEFPFLSIMIIPPSIITAVCVTPGQAYNIDVPDSAIIGCFKGNGEYYLSKQSAAQIPAVSGEGNSLYMPEYSWFALNGVKQISVVAPVANTIVQLHCYTRL